MKKIKEMKDYFLKVFKNKKTYWYIAGAILLFILWKFTDIFPFKKIDDWQYNVEDDLTIFDKISNSWFWIITIGVVVLSVVLTWLIWSIKWIKDGKDKVVDGKIVKNPKKFLGYTFLFTPLIFTIIIILINIVEWNLKWRNEDLFNIIYGMIMMVLFIFLIVKPLKLLVKNKLWWGFVLFLTSIISSLVMVFATAYLMVKLSTPTSQSDSISLPAIPNLPAASLKSGVTLDSFSTKSLSVNENIGFSVGGAKDVDNFRENISNNFLPLTSDITHEGIYYDYYFDTGNKEECKELFCPAYSTAVSEDPFSKEKEYYMTVGLNSGIKENDFKRKKLNIDIVLDISGSMGSTFDKYYYDNKNDPEENSSKMKIATEVIADMLDHLDRNDSLSVTLFDDEAYLAKPFRVVKKTDIGAIKKHILDLKPRGGTNMEAGIKLATEEFKKNRDFFNNPAEVENRIIFLTDAMPNSGDHTAEKLKSMAERNAKDYIFMTFIGIGVDFNSDLVSKITKIRGANYFSVHSSLDFKKRLVEEFDYFTTPLVYNLNLAMDSDDYEIEDVYGVPESDLKVEQLMKIGTLFPSKNENGETKGGVILVRLSKKDDAKTSDVKIIVNYEDRAGKKHTVKNIAKFDLKRDDDYYDNSGIHKAIVLSRFVEIMKRWVTEAYNPSYTYNIERYPFDRYGIYPPVKRIYNGASKWERKSEKLKMSTEMVNVFEQFKKYFSKEVIKIEDFDLMKEVELIDKIIKNSSKFESIKKNTSNFFSIGTAHPSAYIDADDNKIFIRKWSSKKNKWENFKELGNFNSPFFSTRYKEKNKPDRKYDRIKNNPHKNLSIPNHVFQNDRVMFIGYSWKNFMKALGKMKEECYAANFSGGHLDRDDNFWTCIKPKESILDK